MECSKIQRPWDRFAARIFDMGLLVCLFCLLDSAYRLKTATLNDHMSWLIAVAIIWVPVEAILMATWGFTPGKKLMDIRVKTSCGEKLTLKSALHRAAWVFAVGEGFCIPYVSTIAYLFAYAELTESTDASTWWDRRMGLEVHCGVKGGVRLVLVLLACLGLYLSAAYILLWTMDQLLGFH